MCEEAEPKSAKFIRPRQQEDLLTLLEARTSGTMILTSALVIRRKDSDPRVVA